ncbi:MAG: hypothetical protein QXQ69_00185 [Candidatus Aenigmatarchaeota archaeon]
MKFWDKIKYKDEVFYPVDVFWVPHRTDEKGKIIEEAKWINPFENSSMKFSELPFDDFMSIICKNNLLIARYYDKEKGEVYLFPLKKGGIMPKELFSQENTVFYTKKKVD